MKAGDIVLVDTTLIIEAHNTGCLTALAAAFRLQTVETCVRETQDGSATRADHLRIDEGELRAQINAVHAVTDAERAVVAAIDGPILDDGERDLWAHALARTDAWILCGPDKASMRFGYKASMRARLVTLEALLREIGHTPKVPIRAHYRQEWLDDVMTNCVLGLL
jgi:hypothetical protein